MIVISSTIIIGISRQSRIRNRQPRAFEQHVDGSPIINHTEPDNVIYKMTQGFARMLNFSHWCFKFPSTPSNSCTWFNVRQGPPADCLWSHIHEEKRDDRKDCYPWRSRQKASIQPSVKGPLWNCTNIINCTTGRNLQNSWVWLIPSLRHLISVACLCQNYTKPYPPEMGCNTSISFKDLKYSEKSSGRIPQTMGNCDDSPIYAPRQLTWICSDGTITDMLNPIHPGLQCTLGVPSLCPPYYSEKFISQGLWHPRTKRATNGTGWTVSQQLAVWAEGFFGLGMGHLRTRIMLSNLTAQVETLADLTNDNFELLNAQVQAVSRVTLQNRLVLDMILLKEQGVCGYLKANHEQEECCVTIPNVSLPLRENLQKMKKIAEATHELQDQIKNTWLGNIFAKIGWGFTGWITNLLQTFIVIIICIIVVCIAISCVKRIIVKSISQVRVPPGDWGIPGST
uniref:Envelope protein n=1 Tax=Calidris pygmaea TaxID=425635 RepID=A0A8C3KBG7_9CHAR